MGSQQGRPEIPAGMKDSMREVRFTSAEGEGSIRSKLAKGGPIAVRLRIPPDSDVEGHSLGDTVVLAVAKFDDSDVEGHALSIHFPDAGQARHFRNEMIAAGAQPLEGYPGANVRWRCLCLAPGCPGPGS